MDASTTAATNVSPSPAQSPDDITPAFQWSDAATKNLIMVVEKKP